MKKTINIPPQTVPGGWVVGGTSRVLDVWTPSPLILRAPAFRYPPHELHFSLEPGVSGPKNTTKPLGRLRRARRFDTVRLEKSDVVFDCRHDSTANVAHVLQNQIGVALHGLRALSLEDRWRELVFVLGEHTPSYAVAVFHVLGLRTVTAAGGVSGTLLRMQPLKFPLRAIACDVLRTHALRIGLLSEGEPPADPVFLSRRGRRTVTNLEEIEPLVNRAGYRTVYLEDLAATDQIRTVAMAERVIGLHGAGMGFLMFQDPKQHGVIVECFSSVYASNWVRAIAAQLNKAWLGGQGNLDGKAISEIAAGSHARSHEDASYRMDSESVSRLLEMANIARSGPGLLTDAVIDELLAVRPSTLFHAARPNEG